MFCRLSILPVINKVPGASPMTEYVKGIFHSSGGAFLKLMVKRSCVSETLPPSPRLTFTMGNPGCSLAIPTRRVGSRGKFLRNQTSHCRLKCAVHFVPIQEANPSLSQRLSHQAIVTRSPNH